MNNDKPKVIWISEDGRDRLVYKDDTIILEKKRSEVDALGSNVIRWEWDSFITRCSLSRVLSALRLLLYTLPDVRATEQKDDKPDPGEGYRLLNAGETIQDEDEHFNLDRIWEKTICAGTRIDKSTHCYYRRKIEQPKSKPTRQRWVILGEGDTVNMGDEYFSSDEMWESVDESWIGDVIHKCSRPHRRLEMIL